MRAISDPPFFQSFTVSQAWSTRYPRLCRFITREKIDVNIWNWRVAARGRGGHNFIASFYDLWESCVLLCVYATLEPSPARGRTLLFFFPSIATRKFPSLSLTRFPFQFHAPLRLLQASRYETVARLLRVTTVSNLMRVGKISYSNLLLLLSNFRVHTCRRSFYNFCKGVVSRRKREEEGWWRIDERKKVEET